MGIEKEIDALAADAIASSEKEFFDEAMGKTESVADDTGDTSLEKMGNGLEGQQEADEDDSQEQGDADQEAGAKAEADRSEDQRERDETGRFKSKDDKEPKGRSETPAERGLRNELTSEREKRKTAESEVATLKAETERRFAELTARLNQTQPTPQQEPKKEEIPDRWTDPDGYDRYHREQILREVRGEVQVFEQRRILGSFEAAKEKHGDDFAEAYRVVDAFDANNPVQKQTVDAILQSANPGERLVAWYRQQKAAQEIGNDPAAYKQRLIAETRESLMKDPEFRRQLVENLEAEARNPPDGSRRTAVQLPPSLNSARGGATRVAPVGGASDGDIFSEVMA